MSETERPIREIAFNRKAKRDYEILDTLEVGIVLVGTEVKTLRNGHVSLAESFVKIRDGQMWLEKCHIDEYVEGNVYNHDPVRSRRLLAHKRETVKWFQKMKEKGLTVVPLRLFFKGRHAKLEIAMARGRKQHDKRQALKDRDSRKELRGLRRR
ncbi:MAG: SsrA-binding protein SmpB [Planctomycetes bacterium]|jgi:SsrA-binding protein|nr:SsrA-binding protein SmpB [Planctomycetota bacterium]NQU47193.1 SsrA-binding protein SmpB [Planctomycetota bacterium]